MGHKALSSKIKKFVNIIIKADAEKEDYKNPSEVYLPVKLIAPFFKLDKKAYGSRVKTEVLKFIKDNEEVLSFYGITVSPKHHDIKSHDMFYCDKIIYITSPIADETLSSTGKWKNLIH